MTSHRENEQENRKKILLWSVGATTFLISEYFGMSMKYVGYILWTKKLESKPPTALKRNH